ncbi:hypothetical protein CI109_107041 [Kwoniella shandongensis]|uniref:Uncharacterized protein n=1 Tax=Kwoniella shandongensis TaxID=1734106 RepID=A0A5M6BT14_9TREE|nr:uncharacterized protein CI109_006449 [Kwoniella shandongensis]KAA5525180.1 hypothetical protein CI109_006449 [Kwoniella shandongensis]
MSSPTLLVHMPTSPLGSPRSSTSSGNPSGPLLTPLDELDKAASEMVITEREVKEDEVDDADLDPRSGPGPLDARHVFPSKQQIDLASLPGSSSRPSFTDFSFPPHSTFPDPVAIRRPPSHSPGEVVEEDVPFPTAGFSFGTCPSVAFLGTPTAEQGPFEYPEIASPKMAPIHVPIPSSSRESFALGMTHRRGSIVAHPVHHPVNPSPPSTRRSSTCSTITTLPSAGRRPSILHSSTIETTVPLVNPTSTLTPMSPPPTSSSPPLPSAPPSRRSSTLMFKQKPLPAPIPPSLLARRGSLPAAQLFGLPLGEQPNRTRASYSAGPHVTTTAELYNRRQSMASESGMSSGSAATVMEGDGPSRRGSMRLSNLASENRFPGARRGSIPFLHPFHPPSSLGENPVNRTGSFSSSSRSSFASSSRSSMSSISARNSIISSSTTSSSRYPAPSSPIYSPKRSTSLNDPVGQTSPTSAESRRPRHHSSHLSGLSSSEESNEDEEEEEEDELPTPAMSMLNANSVPSAPAFMDPWSNNTSTGTEMEARKLNIPLDTPPLETVLERPPLETIASDRTEKA